MGYAALIAAGILYGTRGLIIRGFQGTGLHPMAISLLRLALAWAIITVIILVRDRRLFHIERRDVWQFALLAVIGQVGTHSLYIWTMTITTAAAATIMHYTAPVSVAIISRVLWKERIGKSGMAAILLTIAGLALVTGILGENPDVSPQALAAGLGSGFLWAVTTIFLKGLSSSHSPLTIKWWEMLFGIPAIALTSWPVIGPLFTVLPAKAYGAGMAYALGPGMLAPLLFIAGVARTKATSAAIISALDPVVTAVLGYVFLGESLSAAKTAGMALVLAGVIMVSVSRQMRGCPVSGGLGARN